MILKYKDPPLCFLHILLFRNTRDFSELFFGQYKGTTLHVFNIIFRYTRVLPYIVSSLLFGTPVYYLVFNMNMLHSSLLKFSDFRIREGYLEVNLRIGLYALTRKMDF